VFAIEQWNVRLDPASHQPADHQSRSVVIGTARRTATPLLDDDVIPCLRERFRTSGYR